MQMTKTGRTADIPRRHKLDPGSPDQRCRFGAPAKSRDVTVKQIPERSRGATAFSYTLTPGRQDDASGYLRALVDGNRQSGGCSGNR